MEKGRRQSRVAAKVVVRTAVRAVRAAREVMGAAWVMAAVEQEVVGMVTVAKGAEVQAA